MNRLTSLPFLFRVVAIVELLYATVGLLTPPSMVFAVTGWNLCLLYTSPSPRDS